MDTGVPFQLVAIGDANLEVHDAGVGEPVLFIQTGLTADELRPLADAPALSGYRRILYHRRGYAGSSPTNGRGSIAGDADDARALLAALAIDRAHIVGFSYSGAVGLQLARDAAACAHTLTLIEPPPVHTPSASEFRAANERLIRTRSDRGAAAALDVFLSQVIGPTWRAELEEKLPAAVAQMERDTPTFFDTDLPALLAWQFAAEDAHTITCPVLHIGGTDSGAWFAEVRELILAWFPEAEDVVVAGADHSSLTLTHMSTVAAALAVFLGRHRLSP